MRSMSTRKVLAKNAFWSLASHLLSRGALMVTAIILARSFSPSDFAAYSYFQITMTMIGAYAALGLGTTASRYFAEVGHEQNGNGVKPLGALLSISTAVSIMAGLLLLSIPEPWLNADLDVPIWLMAAGAVATALGVVPGGAILGLEQYRSATVISLFHGFLLVSSAVIAATYQMPILAMWAVVGGAFLQAVGQLIIVVRIVGWERISQKIIFDSKDLKQIFRFAGPMLLVTIISASGFWLVGRIVLEGNNGHYSFSLYSIGMQWYALALLLPGIVSRVVLPRLVREGSESNDNAKQIVKTGVLFSLITGFLLTGLAFLFGPWIAEIYGTQYEFNRFFIAAYMAAALLSAPTNTLGNAIVARDGQLVWLRNTIFWLAVILISAYAGVYFDLKEWTGSVAFGVAGGALLFVSYRSCRNRGLV